MHDWSRLQARLLARRNDQLAAAGKELSRGDQALPNESPGDHRARGTITDPEKLPGGLASRNPYVIAGKFVLEKGAPERDVKQTAKAIADEIVKLRAQVAGQGSYPVP